MKPKAEPDLLLEELDIERFAKAHPGDRMKPCAKVYVIRIDQEYKRIHQPLITGEQILELVEKTPETHRLYQKHCGGEVVPISPDQDVSVRAPGVERFQTIPLDSTEGERGA